MAGLRLTSLAPADALRRCGPAQYPTLRGATVHPIGRRVEQLWLGEEDPVVVGIVATVKQNGLARADEATIYYSLCQNPPAAFAVALRGTLPPATFTSAVRVGPPPRRLASPAWLSAPTRRRVLLS